MPSWALAPSRYLPEPEGSTAPKAEACIQQGGARVSKPQTWFLLHASLLTLQAASIPIIPRRRARLETKVDGAQPQAFV